jgi:urea carboxylase-associated protein 1
MAGILLAGASAEERAAHARALSAEMQARAREQMAEIRARIGTAKLDAASAIPGEIVDDQVVPAGGRYSRKVAAGNRLRIIDLEGRQAVDFMVYDVADYENRYNAANTLKFNGTIFIGKGSRLYSDRAEVLMTVVDDTLGYHDTIGGCCSTEANHIRYGIPDTPSCRNNFIAALAEHGLGPRDLPANVNFFMYVPVREDGSTAILEGMSEPGDYVDLHAERGVLAVVSNCPQVYNPCNGWIPTPIRIVEWRATD